MILFALDFFERNALGGGLVVTSMTTGTARLVADAGIAIVETDVGRRNVLIELEEKAWPSAVSSPVHLIFRSLAPTGDGQLTVWMLPTSSCDADARRAGRPVWRRCPATDNCRA